ncbi:MAG: DUF1949 domain-containing protein [Bacteroidetes bacterium]|nr:MAG: DUF1949 domain-containing protein [Bacteroidota bacterium]
MQDTYKMMTAPTEAIFRDKGSKFLAYAYPVQTEDEVKARLQDLRKQYFDATHHCYAYLLGYRQDYFRVNDDGEPNHTAGTPILNQIKAQGLTNTLVVVVRYFGGTKLGVTGLINAYKSATALALQEASLVEKPIQSTFIITFGYPQMNQIMRFVREYEAEVAGQALTETCEITLKVRLGLVPALRKALTDLAYEGIKFDEKQEGNVLYLF